MDEDFSREPTDHGKDVLVKRQVADFFFCYKKLVIDLQVVSDQVVTMFKNCLNSCHCEAQKTYEHQKYFWNMLQTREGQTNDAKESLTVGLQISFVCNMIC